MFSGSDEFVLREIADESHKIPQVINLLFKNAVELEFANCLKLYELGFTDEELFKKQKEWYFENKKMFDDMFYGKK